MRYKPAMSEDGWRHVGYSRTAVCLICGRPAGLVQQGNGPIQVSGICGTRECSNVMYVRCGLPIPDCDK
jgi:hypothetical protein